MAKFFLNSVRLESICQHDCNYDNHQLSQLGRTRLKMTSTVVAMHDVIDQGSGTACEVNFRLYVTLLISMMGLVAIGFWHNFTLGFKYILKVLFIYRPIYI